MGLLEIYDGNLDLDSLDPEMIRQFRKTETKINTELQEEQKEALHYLDFHCDTLTAIKEGSLYRNSGDVDLERALSMSTRYAQVFAIFQDAATVSDREAAFDAAYARAMELLKQASPFIRFCRTGQDLKDAMEANMAAAFLSVEDVSQMGKKADQCRELGICEVMLTWNYENEYGYSSRADQKGGLKPEGKSLAKRLLEQGVLLDGSHLSDQGIDDLLELTDGPIIASHSNVRDIQDNTRNLNKTHIREIIARGGIIGMNMYRHFVWNEGHKAVELSDLRRHMDYILEEGGEDCLALGCDLDGCSGLFPEGFYGIQSIPVLRDNLKAAGYEDTLIEKILFRNGYDFLVENLK